MRVRSLVVIALAAAICAVILCSGIEPASIRIIPAVLLMFLLPGLALALALPRAAGWPERLAIALAASMSLLALAAVALDALGIEIGSTQITVVLAVLTVAICAAVALWSEPDHAPPLPSLRAISRRDAAFVAVGVALLAGAGVISALSVERQRDRDTFTQLWALPAPGQTDVAQVGITNHEGDARTYVVSTTIGRGDVMRRQVSLADGETSVYEQLVEPDAGPLRVSLSGGDHSQSVSLDLNREPLPAR